MYRRRMASSPLAGLDANLLVAIDALLAEGHVGRAARRLGLSPSAMSHALARARALVGDPLLIRTAGGMVLTARARAIAPGLREGLARAAAAVAPPVAFDPAAEETTLRIAAADFPLLVLAAPLMRALAVRAPRVDVIVVPFAGQLGVLASGEVDVALAAHRVSPRYRCRVLAHEPFACVVRRGHPALARPMTVRRWAALGHVLVSPRGRVRGAVDRALASRGLRRRVAFVSPTFLGAAQVVAATDLVLTCGARSAAEAAPRLGLHVFTPPVPVEPFPLGMFWHQRQDADPFLAWTRSLLAEIASHA
jgi:DNA-binding transcriptional LysR family regulator